MKNDELFFRRLQAVIASILQSVPTRTVPLEFADRIKCFALNAPSSTFRANLTLTYPASNVAMRAITTQVRESYIIH
jgi:hypothetical protein